MIIIIIIIIAVIIIIIIIIIIIVISYHDHKTLFLLLLLLLLLLSLFLYYYYYYYYYYCYYDYYYYQWCICPGPVKMSCGGFDFKPDAHAGREETHGHHDTMEVISVLQMTRAFWSCFVSLCFCIVFTLCLSFPMLAPRSQGHKISMSTARYTNDVFLEQMVVRQKWVLELWS